MKIENNQPVVAYHIVDGATAFNYAIDARHAVSSHPNEWSETPWSADDAEVARKRLADAGKPLPEPAPLSPEDQAALDEYNATVAAAKERLAARQAKIDAEKAEEAQAAMDEAIVASAPPKPDPEARRPFGRKGEPTAAEKKQMEKQAAKQAERDRIAKEKADADKGAGVQISN